MHERRPAWGRDGDPHEQRVETSLVNRSSVHAGARFLHEAEPARRGLVHKAMTFSTETGPFSTRDARGLDSVGVDQLADGGQLAPKLVVVLALPVDLGAGMQNGGMVPPAELGTDAQQ